MIPKIRFRAPLAVLPLLMASLLAAPAVFALPRQQNQGSMVSLSAQVWAFNQCVSTSRGLALQDRATFLRACCGQVESSCQQHCVAEAGLSDTECLTDCSMLQHECENGNLVVIVTPNGAQDSYVQPVVSEILPSPRVDFCLDADSGCGGPAAHTVCQRELGAEWAARYFEGDAIPASLDDPTWQLGRWYPRQPYGSGQGFGIVECEPLDGRDITFDDVPIDADLDGVTDLMDNCPHTANPLQGNADGDLFGDHCDLAPQIVYACSNGLDDDGDGLADADDPGCVSDEDDAETQVGLACDNGADDDGDGFVDLADLECSDPSDVSEAAARCADGADDDGDGLVDLADPGCTSAGDDSEYGEIWTTEYDASPHETCYYFFGCTTWSWTGRDHSRHLADVDGDARDDVVAFRGAGVEVALATGGAFGSGALWTTEIDVTAKRFRWGNVVLPRFVTDVDDDGLADLVFFDVDVVFVARSTGTGFGPAEVWSAPGQIGAGRFLDPAEGAFWGYPPEGEAMLEDVDGDGLRDVVLFDAFGTVVALNQGDGFGAPSYWSDDFGTGPDSPFQYSVKSRHLADVDGDGFLDLVGFTSSATWLAFGTGAGFEASTVSHPEFGYPWGAVEQNFLEDVDGDGAADIVAFGSTHMRVARGGSEGFGVEEYWLSDFGAWERDFRNDLRIVQDLNDDGLADFLISDAQGISVWHSTGEGPGDRMVLGYGFTSGPIESWDNRGTTPRQLADVDGDGIVELTGFGRDGLAVAELGIALDPIPLPEPSALGASLCGAALILVLARRRGARRQA